MSFLLDTPRLRLRQWRESDYLPFAQLNADAEVMRYFPKPLTRDESDAVAKRIQGLIHDNGWGFWAVELKQTGEFIGFVGLHFQDAAIPHTPFVEIGWRLSSNHWGKGYAPEAAEQALAFAFDQLEMAEVYAFTPLPNKPSQRVMEKIGMSNINKDFDHPKLDKGHPMERHCLYKISAKEWRSR